MRNPAKRSGIKALKLGVMMAYLIVPREITRLACFHQLQGAPEIAGMFQLIANRYGRLAGGSRNTGREFAIAGDGATISLPNNTIQAGTSFGFAYYSLNTKVIIFELFVHRNMQLLPAHDTLKILEVHYSSAVVEPGWMAAYWDPSCLSYAGAGTIKAGHTVSDGQLVADEPQMVLSRDPVQGGCDISEAGAINQITARCDKHHPVANPADVPEGGRFNLNLSQADMLARVQAMIHGL